MKSGTLILALLSLASCRSDSPSGPYTPASEAARDPQRSQELTQRASEVFASDPGEAEKLLREALTADLFNGQAHNNLGILYLGRSLLYEAAGEFEWARKLMPGHPDPRLNLGLVLERAGQVHQAVANYRSALEVSPGNVPATQALARVLLRNGEKTDDLHDLVETVGMRGETEAWRRWARERLIELER